MAEVRIFNPARPMINPSRAKPWTEKQAETKKDQAERFERDVLEDDDRADEIADMSVAEYAESRHKEIVPNPRRRSVKRKSKYTTRDDDDSLQTNANLAVSNSKLADQQRVLLERVDGLEAEKQKLQDKIDEALDIARCNDPDCDIQDHLDDIIDTLENGGNGNGDDDDD